MRDGQDGGEGIKKPDLGAVLSEHSEEWKVIQLDSNQNVARTWNKQPELSGLETLELWCSRQTLEIGRYRICGRRLALDLRVLRILDKNGVRHRSGLTAHENTLYLVGEKALIPLFKRNQPLKVDDLHRAVGICP